MLPVPILVVLAVLFLRLVLWEAEPLQGELLNYRQGSPCLPLLRKSVV